MNKLFFGIVLLAILSACHKKKIIKTINAPDYHPEVSKRQTRKLIKAKEADFTFLNCKSKIEFSDGVDNFNASANIRVKKDSIIWVSITATLGIEAVRCLITTDSVYIINKLQKEYYCYSYQSLKKRLNFDINYNLIQSVLYGNTPFKVIEQDSSYDCIDTSYTNTKQIRGDIQIQNYIKNNTLKLHKLDIGNIATSDKISITYDDFRLLDIDSFFGFINKISLNYQNRNGFQSFYLGLEHQKVETGNSDLKFPFNVKQKFERKE